MIYKICLVVLSYLLLPCVSWGLCVKVKKANLRLGPGTHYEKTWQVYKYMPFKKIGKKGRWIHIKDLEGDKHWIHSKLVTKKYLCAAVKTSTANLRTGPGVRYSRSSSWYSAPLYTSFKYLKRKGKWAQLKDIEGVKYWVSRKLLWIN